MTSSTVRTPESLNPAFIGRGEAVPVKLAPGVMVMTEHQERHLRRALFITGSEGLLDDYEIRRP